MTHGNPRGVHTVPVQFVKCRLLNLEVVKVTRQEYTLESCLTPAAFATPSLPPWLHSRGTTFNIIKPEALQV